VTEYAMGLRPVSGGIGPVRGKMLKRPMAFSFPLGINRRIQTAPV